MDWDSIKDSLVNTYLHPRHIGKRELIRIIRRESAQLTGTLLDVGCAKKPYQSFFEHVDLYVGVDLPSSVYDSEVVDIFADASRLPFPDRSYESILCTELLEHLPNPNEALSEFYRITKPGGSLLLTVPMSEQLHEVPRDYFRFTEYGIRALLVNCGWKIVRMHTRGGAWLEFGYRLSGFLYTEIGSDADPTRRSRPRMILGPLAVLLCAFIQISAAILDRIWPSKLSTLGYGVLVEKPA